MMQMCNGFFFANDRLSVRLSPRLYICGSSKSYQHGKGDKFMAFNTTIN
jgi:hypothetical protein